MTAISNAGQVFQTRPFFSFPSSSSRRYTQVLQSSSIGVVASSLDGVKTGEIYPEVPGDAIGDSIGNIFDE